MEAQNVSEKLKIYIPYNWGLQPQETRYIVTMNFPNLFNCYWVHISRERMVKNVFKMLTKKPEVHSYVAYRYDKKLI